MNKADQETPFSEKTIKFRPHIVYKFFGPFNSPRRLLQGWHLFPFQPVQYIHLLGLNEFKFKRLIFLYILKLYMLYYA